MSKSHILTKDLLETEYKTNKKTVAEIARDLDISRATIFKYIKKYNIQPNKRLDYQSDLTDKQFGRWKVLAKAPQDKFHKSKWFCICECGRKKIVNASSLLRGISLSCGCIKREKCCTGYKEISGAWWNKFKKNADVRQISFNISIKYVWNLFIQQNGKCALSGLEIKFNTDNDKSYLQTASIDRIDSNKGYIKGNVQWVHKNINFMKSNLSDEEFIGICHIVANYNQSKNTIIDLENYTPRKKRIYYENNKERIFK